MSLNREIPHSYDAEQSVLGAILVNNRAYDRVSEILRPEHFSHEAHSRIYEISARLIDAGKIATPVTLTPHLQDDRFLEDVGGVLYIASLANACVSVVNAADYARLIYDLHMKRSLIEVGETLVNQAYAKDIDALPADKLLEATEARLFELSASGTADGDLREFGTFADDALKAWESAYQRRGQPAGIPTGLVDLDKCLGGLNRSDLLILAGRPAMGKAQPFDAMVKTLSGWKRMGDLRFGDVLASVDGAPSIVTGIFPQGERQVYRVTLSDGRSTRCCAEHLWLVDSCKWSGGPKVMQASEIMERIKTERYRHRITVPLASGDFGHNEPLPVDPWLLGAILGNGNVTGCTPLISTMDAATLFRVQRAIGDGLEVVNAGTDYDYRIRAAAGGVNTLALALRSIGVTGKSNEKFIPRVYLDANRASRVELLRGLMDTDGWVEKFGVVRYSSSSRQLALDVQELVRSLGGICTIAERSPKYTYKGEGRVGLPHFVCNIRMKNPAEAMTLIRKQRRCGTPRMALTIVSVEPDGIEPVQCISVSHPSSLYVTDGYTVTHNTSLATSMLVNAARQGAKVAFFSLEMSGGQLAQRIISAHAGVDGGRARKGEVDASEFERLTLAANEFRELGVYIDDTAAVTVQAIRNRSRRMKRKKGLDVIAVDYIGLATPTTGVGSRVHEIEGITKGLKALAKELDVPVIALSQLSRAVETREDKRPQLSDLRDSGSIEQDADCVMFVYREQYYLERAEPARRPEENDQKFNDRYSAWLNRLQEVTGVAEAIIAKNRHGPSGSVRLAFDGPTTRFSNLYQGGME